MLHPNATLTETRKASGSKLGNPINIREAGDIGRTAW
jgi:hypothetical protein